MEETQLDGEREERAAQARHRAQQARLRWAGAIALSYGIDTIFLALYASIGTVPGYVAAGYAALGFGFCLAYAGTVATGWNLKLADPSVAAPGAFWGVAVQLVTVAIAPQIAAPQLVNVFTVFAFSTLWLPVRQAAATWAATVAGTGALLYFEAGRLGAAFAPGAELILSWLYLSLILSRFLVLTVYANRLRAGLVDSRRRLRESLEQIRRLALFDELTEAFNRRSLLARLEEESSRAQRTRVPFSLAMMDLDRFKDVNDRLGHAAGDAMLRTFARVAQAAMRRSDIFGRYGGEEFMLILTASGKAGAASALERVCAAVAMHDWEAIAPGLRLTVSAGLAEHRDGESVEQLINRADAALYEAKRAGRNRVETAD